MALGLAWSNEVKCQRDFEAFWLEAYWLELPNPACVPELYRAVLLLSREFNVFVAPNIFISNICSSVYFSIAEITEKLRKDYD